jgi:hypothetical protein
MVSFLPLISTINRITSSISQTSHNDTSLPWPATFLTQGMFFFHMGEFLFTQVCKKKDLSYFLGTAVNLTVTNNPTVQFAAQIILIFRNAMKTLQAQTQLKKSFNSLTSVLSESFPTPMRLLKDKTLYLHQSGSPYVEFLKIVPSPIAYTAIRIEQIVHSIDHFLAAACSCGWSYVQLGFSIFIDKMNQFTATNEAFANMGEIYDSLTKDPEQISREITANETIIDSFLPHINSGLNAKNISNSLTTAVVTSTNVVKAVTPVFEAIKGAVQQAAFIVVNMATNLSIAPLGASRTQGTLYNGSLHCSYSTCKTPVTKFDRRFCSPD